MSKYKSVPVDCIVVAKFYDFVAFLQLLYSRNISMMFLQQCKQMLQ